MRIAMLIPAILLSSVVSAQVRPVPPAAAPVSDMPLLTVTGTAEAAAAPDRATLRLGAVAQAGQAADAQSQVSAVVQKVVDALKKVGVAEADLSTAGISLSPVYSQPSPRGVNNGEPFTPKITAYRAENTVVARLSDLTKVGPAIDAATAAGANQVESLTFDLKDDTAARARALTDAVKQGRAKAEALARAAGVRLVYLHDLEESGGVATPVAFGGGVMRAMAAQAPTPVEPGQVHLSASVTLRYAIVPAEQAGGGK